MREDEKQITISSNSTVTRSRDHDWTPGEIELLRRQCAKDATDEEFKVFLYMAKHSGLDPLKKQIYFQKYKNRKTGEWNPPTHITSIDGYRLIASRTGQHLGTSDAVFDIDPTTKKVISATIAVRRLVGGHTAEFQATAFFNEYVPKNGYLNLWESMPRTMIAKCAEALALRKAFPNEMGGLYTKEEMHQAEPPAPPPPKAAPKNVTPPKAVVEHMPMPQQAQAPIDEYVFKVAKKFKGRMIKEFDPNELHDYALNVMDYLKEKGESLKGQLADDIGAIRTYIESFEVK